MQIKGDYFEANKSQRYEAWLLLTVDNKVTIKAVDSSAKAIYQNAALDSIEISPRIANTIRSVTFSDGSLFETAENEAIDQWLKNNKAPNSLAWIYHLESRLSYVLLTLVFVALFSWGFIQYGVPTIAETTAKMLPNDVTQYLGQGSLTLLDQSYLSESKLSSSRQAELLTKFNRYADIYKDLNIKIVFRRGGEIGANAFALPDGHIIFTDEMVALAEDDQELIAILGHEIGHLDRRHLLRRAIQSSLLASLVVLMTGDISFASSAVIAMPVLLLELSYSRAFEIEADQFALNFLTQNGIQLNHFASIMTRLSKQHDDAGRVVKRDKNKLVVDGVSQYLATHPLTQERIKPFITNN